MQSIYLIRHGKSELDGPEESRGLTPEGIEHARQVTERLAKLSPAVEMVFSSPYRRAQLTMEPLATKLGVSLNIETDFHEKRMSDGPVADLKEVRLTMWQDFDFRLPGGESNIDAQKRACSALDKVRRETPGKTLAIGCHGTLIALILNAFDAGFGYEKWRAMTMPDIFRLDFSPSGDVTVDHVGVADIKAFEIQG